MIRAFEKHHFRILYDIQKEPQYAAFFRNFTKAFTIEECENIQKIMGAEFLAFYDHLDLCVGFISLGYLPHGVCEFGYLIFSQFRKQKITEGLLEKVYDYAQKKGMRKIICHILADDIRLVEMTRIARWREVGTLERHCFFNGKFCDVMLFEKNL